MSSDRKERAEAAKCILQRLARELELAILDEWDQESLSLRFQQPVGNARLDLP